MNPVRRLSKGPPATKAHEEDSVALVLSEIGDKVAIRIGGETSMPAFRLTREAESFSMRLTDGRNLEVQIRQGRGWLDAAVEFWVDGVRSNSTMWEERFRVKAWYYFLLILSLFFLGIGLIPIGLDVATSWFGLDTNLHEGLGQSSAFSVAGALLGWICLRFRANPMEALRIQHLAFVLLLCTTPLAATGISLSSLPGILLLACAVVPLWISVRIAVNSLANTGHPDAPLKGPWISWSDVSPP